MGINRGQSRLGRVALAATVVALATAGSAAAFQALPAGLQVNDDPAAGINPAQSVSGEDPTNADVVGRRARGRQAGRSMVGLPPAGDDRPRSDLLALVCQWGVDHPRQRHGGRSLVRQPDLRRVAELRSGAGRRGALDRLRGSRSDGSVGDVVREDDRHRLRRQQRVRESLRCRPEQVGVRGAEPRQRRQRPECSIAEHPHRPERGEPVGGRRLRGRSDQAGSVGDLAGDDDSARGRQGPDLRLEAAWSGHARIATA